MNSIVVVVEAFKSPIIKKCIPAVVKHTPNRIPIFLMDQSNPKMTDIKAMFKETIAPFGDRVQYVEYFTGDRISFAPLGLVQFLLDRPEIQRVIKIDDDAICGSDYFEGLIQGYDSKPNTLLSVAASPIQIWGLHLFKERCGITVDDRLLNPEIMLDTIVHNPQLATDIWRQTIPPEKILPIMRRGERHLEVPLFRKEIDSRIPCERADFIVHHYFAARNDVLEFCSDLNGINKSDEINYQRCRQKTGRPIIMDTWNLIYHFSGAPWFGHAINNEWNMIKDVEF